MNILPFAHSLILTVFSMLRGCPTYRQPLHRRAVVLSYGEAFPTYKGRLDIAAGACTAHERGAGLQLLQEGALA
tara:strand:- start:2993 stop:3214 length:222 start_codon:yes stop_codon:yes gene_type:complete